MKAPKVSVIVPVYNVDRYVERCVRSLFSQTLDSIEYIFIDDCGQDNSVAIIEKIIELFPERKPQTRIIRHEVNKGVGKSRQDGIEAASGEYVIHCDPDDWVEPKMYETLYDKAINENAGVALCDYCIEENGRKSIVRQFVEDDKKSLFHQLSEESLHAAFWNKLVRSDLARQFPIENDINLWEDMSVTPLILLSANRIVKVDRPFYHYNLSNSGSVTHVSYVNNALSSVNAVNSLIRRLWVHELIDMIDHNDLYRLQWSAKKGLIVDSSKDNIRLWNELFPDVRHHYTQIGLSSKFKILTWLAIHNVYPLLNLYKRMKDCVT